MAEATTITAGDGREKVCEGAGRRAVSKHRHGLGKKDKMERKTVWTLAVQELQHADLSV